MAYVPPSRRRDFDQTRARGYGNSPPVGGGMARGNSGGSGGRQETNPCKLFVGGLAWSTNDSTLVEVFGRFGRLTDVKVMMDRDEPTRGRGFGFVTFEDEAAAAAAARETDGLNVDGREIRVNLSDGGVRA